MVGPGNSENIDGYGNVLARNFPKTTYLNNVLEPMDTCSLEVRGDQVLDCCIVFQRLRKNIPMKSQTRAHFGYPEDRFQTSEKGHATKEAEISS